MGASPKLLTTLEDEVDLTVETKLNQFLKQPRYLDVRLNQVPVVSPNSGINHAKYREV